MSHPKRLTINVTTAADGTATVLSDKFSGRIVSVHYIKTNFDNGVDFTITLDTTLQNVWVESNVDASANRAPRQATHDTVGVASLYAAAGEPVEDLVRAADEKVKIVIAAGGNAKTGQFVVVYE